MFSVPHGKAVTQSYFKVQMERERVVVFKYDYGEIVVKVYLLEDFGII